MTDFVKPKQKIRKVEKQQHEELVAKLLKAADGVDLLSAEDEATIKEILSKSTKK